MKTFLGVMFFFFVLNSFSQDDVATKEAWPKEMIDDVNFLLENEVDLKWGTDPFKRKPGMYIETKDIKKKDDNYVLNGIIYDEDDPQAMINGEKASLGKVIGGRTVIEIGQYYVLLQEGDSILELILPEGNANEAKFDLKEFSE